jgi:hypothetical protein
MSRRAAPRPWIRDGRYGRSKDRMNCRRRFDNILATKPLESRKTFRHPGSRGPLFFLARPEAATKF